MGTGLSRLMGQEDQDGLPVLTVDGLTVSYLHAGRLIPALMHVSLQVISGEILGIVGESGCGKSTLGYSIMRYLPENCRIEAGRIEFLGTDILGSQEKDLEAVRGKRISMVPQDPPTSLNPSYRVGSRISEVLQHHLGMSGKEALATTVDLLEQVGIPRARSIVERFPHQLSGGQQQRVLIAMAFCLRPDLVIMDEPTTGLDVATEARILDLIGAMRSRYKTSVIYITHNMAVVRNLCDRIITLYAGEIVEEGSVPQVFGSPRHPYTLGLLRSIPRIENSRSDYRLEAIEGSPPVTLGGGSFCVFSPRCRFAREHCRTETPPLIAIGLGRSTRCFFHDELPEAFPSLAGRQADIAAVTAGRRAPDLLTIRGSSKEYAVRGGSLRAIDKIDLECGRGEIWGIVGESGSGKTTLARCVAGLLTADEGEMRLDGRDLMDSYARRSRGLLKRIQMVFQNPDSTLNPQRTIQEILARPLLLHTNVGKSHLRARIIELLGMVRLGEDYLGRYPHELSGGEKQRAAIARALAPQPDLIIFDEAVASLDVSIQAGILNLLLDLQVKFKTTYLFISHDLNAVRYLCDRIAVLYMGRIAEQGTPNDVFQPPYHPYTESLLSTLPLAQSNIVQRRVHMGDASSDLLTKPTGCVFHLRCPHKVGPLCEEVVPPRIHISGTHSLDCHIPLERLTETDPVFTWNR